MITRQKIKNFIYSLDTKMTKKISLKESIYHKALADRQHLEDFYGIYSIKNLNVNPYRHYDYLYTWSEQVKYLFSNPTWVTSFASIISIITSILALIIVLW